VKKIILLALILRLIGIFLFCDINNYDLQSYLKVGELTSCGINIYPAVANLHHPYFPAFLYIEAFAYWLGRSKIIIIDIIKIINIIFDLGNVYLVYLLSKKNLKSAFLYAVNPVSILIFTLHGQFDSIPIFFLLLSFYSLATPWVNWGILSFSFAVMIKTWPLLFIISLYKRLKNKKLILLTMVFPLVSIIIYALLFKASFLDIGKTLVGYQGLWGIWGVWSLVGKWRLRWQKLSTLIFLLVFFIYSFFKKEKNLIKEIFHLLFFFFILTANFSIQYFSWLIPFLAIVRPKNFWQISLSISGYLILSYLSWFFTLTNQKILTAYGLIIWFYLASIFLVAYRKK